MPEELKPCPMCAAPAARRIRDTGPTNAYRKWVECTAYTCSTNVYLTEDADDRPADDEWNALPHPLVWATEPPQTPGWSWYRGQSSNWKTIVEFVTENHIADTDTVEDEGYWAGPISIPQEPRHD